MTFTFAACLVYNAAVVGSTDQLARALAHAQIQVPQRLMSVAGAAEGAAFQPLRPAQRAASMGTQSRLPAIDNVVTKAGLQALPTVFF